MAVRLDGAALAAKLKSRIRAEAAALVRPPMLAVVLAGEDPASQIYVRGKEQDCAECGIRTRTRYSTVVSTSATGGTFRLLGKTCPCPDNSLASIDGTAPAAPPAPTT